MPFRPTFWPTVFTVPALLVLLGLGTWQLDRLQWKTALIDEIQSRIAAAPAPLAEVLAEAGDDLTYVQYRRVSLTGEFRHDAEMYLAARSMNGNPGYHVVTPFQVTGDGSVLVDRGWVPLERKLPDARAEGQVAGPVTIDGVIRVPRPAKSWLQPDNEPANNMWFWVDLPSMAAHAGAGDAAPVYVEAGPTENPGGFPIGGQTRVNLPNDHLQYGLTWYALAVILAVIYVIYHRRPREAEDGAAGA
jgi:surfeit locus 1 family protein